MKNLHKLLQTGRGTGPEQHEREPTVEARAKNKLNVGEIEREK